MVNYQDGKIYRIVCDTTGEQYIGSTTTTLCQRLAKHRHSFSSWKKGNSGFTSSYPLLERNNYSIILIEDYPCENIEQLCFRERYWIEQYPLCVNKNRKPSSTIEEKRAIKNNWGANNKEQLKQYYNDNKCFLSEKAKVRYNNNKEAILEKVMTYRKNNKDKISGGRKKQHTCECGFVGCFMNRHRHEKSIKHQQYLANNDNKILCKFII